MHDYRAYILGIEERRFVWVENFLSDHPDDVNAVAAAKKLSDSHDVSSGTAINSSAVSLLAEAK